jgi:PAS domain S-box-containing protein
MSEFLRKLFSSDFMPHGYCYLWTPQIVWLHAISDATITLAYYLIPLTLFYFVRKRRDVPFNWMFWMFGIFIFGCGTTHLMEVWTLWHGTYRLAGLIKAVTAVASVATAVSLVALIPRALELPSSAQLTAANFELDREIGERRRAQEALQSAHNELEARVQQRTVELAKANYQLRVEISERKRAEEGLRKQASLLDLAHDAIIVRDLDNKITFWSPGAEETYGWERDEALGKGVQGLLQSAYPSDVRDLNKAVIREGRWAGELTQTRRDGKQIVVASRWALQRDDNGEPAAILQINTDITERKQAEENLRRSEAFLAEGQSLGHTGSFGWNVASGELEFSRETFRILAFDPEQPVPSFEVAMERVHPEDRAFADRILDASIREKKDFELEVRLALPDGSTRYVHVVGRALANERGDLEFIGTLMDVTGRKQAEQTLQTAQTQLAHMARVITMGELAASIAHEVNQPLAAVVANASACLRWLGGANPNLDEARTTVTRIVKEGTRAGEVIGRIRSLMKKSPPRMSSLNINELIDEVLVLTRHEIVRHGVSLRTELADGLPAIIGDTVQLQQVILNLILNAIEATTARSEEQRELLLTSQSQGPDQIVITVQDSGVGIDPRNVDQLFEPFFTTKSSGMGMGLSISRSAIEAHGGRLWATANEGLGATFQFSLPAGSVA